MRRQPLNRKIRVLIVEDSDDDALLLLWELKRGGFEPASERVDTRAAMEQALLRGPWDLVISDYLMPGFSGLEALALLQRRGLDIPFIIVSGNIGEDVAVEAMKAGAHDYVMKHNLSRLGPAIERELREAQVRRARLCAEQKLRENEARLRAIASNIPGMVFQLARDAEGRLSFSYVSEGCHRLLNVGAEALVRDASEFLERILREDRVEYERALARSAADLTDTNWEGRILVPGSDEIKWINIRSGPPRQESGATVWEGIMANITQSKLAEMETRRSREQLSAFSSHVQQAKEQEREKIAREVRDDIGGNLTAIKMAGLWIAGHLPRGSKQLAEKAQEIERLADRTMEITNRIARELRPGILDLGLVAAIEWQAEEFEQRTGIACGVSCREEELGLERNTALTVFRVLQEALDNVGEHARATRVDIELECTGRFVVLNVTDDGSGVTPEDMAKPGAFGIRSMLERARALGGDVEVLGLPGRGTRVILHVPVRTDDARAPERSRTEAP